MSLNKELHQDEVGIRGKREYEMFCKNCGKEVNDGCCSNCGTKINENDNCSNEHNINLNIGRQYNPYKTNTCAIWSLVLACTSFVFGWFITAVVAIILGNTAKNQMRERNEQGYGLASAGVVLGWINIGLSIFAIMIILIVIVGVFSWV